MAAISVPPRAPAINWMASSGDVQWREAEELEKREGSEFAVEVKARGRLLL